MVNVIFDHAELQEELPTSLKRNISAEFAILLIELLCSWYSDNIIF